MKVAVMTDVAKVELTEGAVPAPWGGGGLGLGGGVGGRGACVC